MYRSSTFYGRKGLPIAVILVIGLAFWDLVGHILIEPVYKIIGRAIRDRLNFYCTSPEPAYANSAGFNAVINHRNSVAPDFQLRVDCYMALTVPYTIELVSAAKNANLNVDWWEECLSPDDFDGYALLNTAHPDTKFTHGEHESPRYGFGKLIEGRYVDILQPDIMWVGGLTDSLKISSMAAAYDIPVVPHASGPHSYHFLLKQSHCPFQEYVSNRSDAKSVLPVFGVLFLDEPVPAKGYLHADQLNKPGFGLLLNPAVILTPGKSLLMLAPSKNIPNPNDEEDRTY